MNSTLEKLHDALASAQTLSEKINAGNTLATALLHVDARRARKLTVEVKSLATSSDDDCRHGFATALLLASRCDVMESLYTESMAGAEEALAIYRELCDMQGEADALLVISTIHHRTSNYKEAVETDEKCLTLYTEIGDEYGIARVIRNMGNTTLRHLGNHNQALEHYHKSLHMFEKLGDRYESARALLSIGRAYSQADEYSRAIEYFMQSYDVFQEFGYFDDIGDALWAIGTTYSQLGDYSYALEYFQKGLVIKKQISDRHGATVILKNIGNIYLLMGDYAQALEYYLQCLSVCEELGDRIGISGILGNIGVLYCHIGDYAHGLEYQLKELALREGNGYKVGDTLSNISRTYLEMGDIESALSYGVKGLEVCRSLGIQRGEAHALEVLGMIYHSMSDVDTACHYYLESLEIRQTIGDRMGEVSSGEVLGRLCIQQGRMTEAKEYLSAVLFLAEDMKMKPVLYAIYHSLSEVYEEEGNAGEALKNFKLYHELEREVHSEEMTKKTKNLQAMHQLERSKNEAEIYRLRNVELARANGELEQANQELKMLNMEKNEFLGIASHDLKNPLSNISLLANLLHTEAGDLTEEEIREYSGDIQMVSRRMFALIKNLLDINAIETRGVVCNPVEFDVSSMVSAVMESYKPSAEIKHIALHNIEMPEVPSVYADVQVTMQVLDNLISNAVKYSPQEKNVWVRIYRVESEERERESEGGFISTPVRIEVRDEGPGLSGEDMKQLFGKFARLSARPTGGEHSTGLGLSIVKRLVEAMHGRVWCESELGRGAAFTVELPTINTLSQ